MVVLVTGGRHHKRPDLIESVLDRALFRADEQDQWMAIIHGGAKGADEHAQKWAEKRRNEGWRVGWWIKPADWSLGKGAGPRRNKEMIDALRSIPNIDRHVLAFPQGSRDWPTSGGTADCIKQARAKGLRVGIADEDGRVQWDKPRKILGFEKIE